MLVWDYHSRINIEIGDKVFVGHHGSGDSLFGEYGKLEKITKNHMIFKTDSGAIIKTKRDMLHYTVGKAKNMFVALNINREFIPIKTGLYL